jgi:hypothetical protein
MKNILVQIQIKLARYYTYEPYFFYIILFANLLPVLTCKFFPTVDGPAHLYNARLIVELIENSNSPINEYLTFNQNLNPNWFGHFILATFLTFLPAFISEKLLLIICLIGLPLSIRYLFKSSGLKEYYLLYLVFPFTYSFLFYFGFYNFNLAVILFFYGIGYWLKFKNNLVLSNIFTLMLVSTLICLSHLIIFILFVLVIIIYSIYDIIIQHKLNQFIFPNVLKKIILQFFTILPGLIISINFILFSNSTNSSDKSYIPIKDLINSIKYIMPIKGINYDGYNVSGRLLLYVFSILITYVTLVNIFSLLKEKRFALKNPIWILLSVMILFLYFTLPDSNGFIIGFVSSRLLLIFFLFIIIALAFQKVPVNLKTILFLTINLTNILIIYHNYKSTKQGCNLANEINAISNVIPSYSTVFVINESDNHLHEHLSNYLGCDKPLIITENYEATMGHFPLRWKNTRANLVNILETKLTSKEENSTNKLLTDYVLVITEPNRYSQILMSNSILQSEFVILKKSIKGTITLLKKKHLVKSIYD